MMADYTDLFRQHVIPRLKSLVRTQGFFLALDLIDFAEAHNVVWDLAIRLGVTRLRDDLIDELKDWVDQQIWEAFEEAEPSVIEQRTIADRVARDIARWERKVQAILQQKQEDAACRMTKAA
jgi:hypothetical protein